MEATSLFDLTQLPLFFSQRNNPLQWLCDLEQLLHSFPLGTIEGTVSSQAFLEHQSMIYIAQGAIVEAGAYIRGPCVIGANTTVRHGAYIRGNFFCATNCLIGHSTEIKDSIFLNHTKAGHFAYIGNSIVGNHVNLGARVTCANLKLSHGSVRLYTPTVIDTGLRKLGAFIGDHSQIGCHVVLSPGTCVGKAVLCHPCLHVKGYIPDRQCITASTDAVATM